jgi:hypothetical protein
MASQEGNRENVRKKPGKLTYFYLNGLLHRSLHINRGADTITTWCYPLEKRVAYTYSDVKKRREPAYTTQEVAKMILRSRLTLEYAILDGSIESPQYTYGLNEHKRKFKYMWSEKNILEAHAYFSTVHRGRPRNDGLITPAPLPTVRELRALIRQEELLYVRLDNGEFVPVWRAPDFD